MYAYIEVIYIYRTGSTYIQTDRRAWRSTSIKRRLSVLVRRYTVGSLEVQGYTIVSVTGGLDNYYYSNNLPSH